MQKDVDRLLNRHPLLKAREIANELGVTRNEVNSFLHAHPGRYLQDDDYRWAIVEAKELVLTLPGRWVTGDDFEQILQQSGAVLDGSANSVRVVFSERCKTMIDCIAKLLALVNQLAHQRKAVTIDFTDAHKTKTYLDRAGFFDQLDKKVEVLPSRPAISAARRYKGQSETLVEFRGVDPKSTNADLKKLLTEKFVQQSTAAYRVAALTVFGELIDNVYEHSQSKIRGFAGLQKYSGRKNHIQTVVSDSGIGIASTLRPALKAHYPSLYKQFGTKSVDSDIGLVVAAMSKGEISRFGGARGLGFKSSRAQAVRLNASFSVRQERFLLRFEYRQGKLVRVHQQVDLIYLLGTHICFDFYID